ncbi:MAG: OmpA family protein, partial [Bacteroidota bacterium]
IGFWVEKPIIPALSIRLYGAMGNMQGQDLNPSQEWLNHPSWNGTTNPLANYQIANADFIYANHQTDFLEASLQAKLYLPFWSNVDNEKKLSAYLLTGLGLMQFEATVDALDNQQAIYDFSVIPINPTTDIEIPASLQQLQDGRFETPIVAGQQTTPLYQIGAGVEWQVHPSINLSLSYRYSWTGTDDLDGYQSALTNANQNDGQHYTTLGISYSIRPKKAEPTVPAIIEPTIQPIETPEKPIIGIPEIDRPQDSIVVPEPKLETIVDLNISDSIVVRRAFENLEFETDEARIRSISFASLNELAGLLQDHPSWKLKISGHTDNTGTPKFNMDLSRRRAEAVRDYINDRGVAPDRFVVEFFGQTQPIAMNSTRAGRQRNRRVELLIIE